MEQVLVLGGSYFIGRRIVEVLLEAGYGVTTLNRGNRPAVPGAIEIHCNREDEAAMKAALAGRQFDAAIDVSGLNARHAEILCSALPMNRLRKFIFISSSAVYPAGTAQPPFSEKGPVGPNPYWGDYGLNKIEAEKVYAARMPGQKVFFRPPYLYGPRNYARRESFVFDHLLKGQPLILPASDPRLQFLHTDDQAAAVLAVLSQDTGPLSVFNTGNEQAVTALEWVRACAEAAGVPAKTVFYDSLAAGRDARDFFPFPEYDNVLDVRKIADLCPAKVDFIEGLKQSFAWFIAHRSEIQFKEQVTANEQEILRTL